MKIAQVVCTFPPYKGGIGNVACSFAMVLSKIGYTTSVFVPKYRNIDDETSEKGFNVIRLHPYLKYGNAGFIPQLLYELKTFDLIYLHYPFYGGAELVWLFKKIFPDKKLIIHYHMDVGGIKWWAKVLSLPSKLVKKSLFSQADIITCASLDYIRHSLISDIYTDYREKFFEIPFGVDITKFSPRLDTDDGEKQPENEKILFVGGLDKAHYFKGLDVLIQAMAKLDNRDCCLDVVGGGELLSQYIEFAREQGISDRVNFHSAVDENTLIRHYQNASVLVLPSINSNEAFGLVLLEAMACAIPVVASDLPGVRTVFQNRVHGFLVEPGNIDDLKDKLNMVLADKDQLNSMGRAARRLMEEKYTIEKLAESLETVIETIV